MSDVNINAIRFDVIVQERGLEIGRTRNVTWIGEDVGIELAVTLSKRLHHAVNLLGFARQPEAPQELPECLDDDEIRKVVQVDERLEDLFVEGALLAKVVANGRLIQPFTSAVKRNQVLKIKTV